MDRDTVSRVLDEIGTLLELGGESPFRARAFYNAARAVQTLSGDLAALLAAGELEGVRGLGPATLAVVRELVETGESSMHRELRERTPPGLFDLLRLPGLGAKRVHQLHAQLGISTLDDLERAAVEERIAALPGFGARTQAKLLEGLAYVRSQLGRRRLPEAEAAAAALRESVAARPEVARVEIAGELRRRLETVGAIELVAAVPGETSAVVASFTALHGTGAVDLATGARITLAGGLEARLRCVPPESFAVALLHATGTARHLSALAARADQLGMRLDADGLWLGDTHLETPDERSIYARLDLPYIEPELRETGDEVAAASSGDLPELLTAGALKGCFHCHTTYSDGRATLLEMAEAARARGWRYLGIADHSQVAAYAGGLSPEEIRRQHAEIDAWNAEHGHELWLFKGIEADILPDGRLDYSDLDDDVLASFDCVVGSVHSNFNMSEEEMTRRVLRALENPYLTFLGHPTGRLLLDREGYRIDMDAVIEAAARRGVGIEINANPHRLDMDWRLWRKARALGVRTAINPDAHAIDGLDDVAYGVDVARKGWLTEDDVVNAWSLDDVRRFFAGTRRR